MMIILTLALHAPPQSRSKHLEKQDGARRGTDRDLVGELRGAEQCAGAECAGLVVD
jgi:hypothetical protein